MKNDLGLFARDWLKGFVPQIDKKLVEIWDHEALNYFGYIERQKDIARQMVTHARAHNLAPSKRIRSAFVLNGYKLAKKPIEDGVWQAAAGIELVHTALLMHDDFMDEDQLRRGFETTNAYYAHAHGKHYGDSMAVNAGDMVLSLGYETFLNCKLEPERVLEAAIHLQRTILNTVIGQAHDVGLGFVEEWSEEDVLAVHQAKTAFYTYENPLIVGAILSQLNPEVIQILKDYARDGGVAFQLQDDILGLFGDPEKTGKSADSDLLQGKATLLIYGVRKFANPIQRAIVEKVWGKKQATKADLEAAKQVIVDCGSLAYNKEKAHTLARKAVEAAEKLRNYDLDPEAIDFIQGVAQYMVEREL